MERDKQSLAPGWQHPFVDVLKLCNVMNASDMEVDGDVTQHMDRIIGKQVFKVRGTVSAGNYARLPKSRAHALGLTGRFLYIQVKVSPVKVFVIHVEVMTADQNTHRISISNMYTSDTLKRRSNGVHIPFPHPSHRWCVMAVDMAVALRAVTASPLLKLKAVQLCSTLTLRSVYTSDSKFQLQSLPRDMALSHAMDTSIFELVWLPAEPTDVGEGSDSRNSARKAGLDKTPSETESSPTPSHPQSSHSPDAVKQQQQPQGSRRISDPTQPRWGAPRSSVGGSSGSSSGGGLRGATTGLISGRGRRPATAGSLQAPRTPPPPTTAAAGSPAVAMAAAAAAAAALCAAVAADSGIPHGAGNASDASAAPDAGSTGAQHTPSPSASASPHTGQLQQQQQQRQQQQRQQQQQQQQLQQRHDQSHSQSGTVHQSRSQGRSLPTREGSLRPPTSPADGAGRLDCMSASAVRIAAAAVGVGGVLPPPSATATGALSTPTQPARPVAASPPLPDVPGLVPPWWPSTQRMGPPLLPDPILSLHRINGFNGECVRLLRWAPRSEELVFAAASAVIAMTSDGTSQRFFLGHTAQVVALSMDAAGVLLASAQEGRSAVVRLWDFRAGTCLTILNAHASGLTCLDLSPDCRALVAVGLDHTARQTMVLWDISAARETGKVPVVVRHPTEFNIKCVRFSEYAQDQLVTCGRDSIRMYRLKAGQLRGGQRQDDVSDSWSGGAALMGPNIFTDIAFQAGVGTFGFEPTSFYVASASGALFQVSHRDRSLQAVFQLHRCAINSLVMLDGLAITGSDDRKLRVWPMDFRDHLLEAEHESSVTSVSLSPDGLHVAIGTENGAIGVLDIPSHTCATLMRSHCGDVLCVAVDPNREEYVTVSSDGTIRIWDLHRHTQLFEFDAPGEEATAVAVHPLTRELAVGFANGRLRVFDVTTTTLVQEHHHHRAAIREVEFSPDGMQLYTGGCDGTLMVLDVAATYTPLKSLSSGSKDMKVCLAASGDGKFLATPSYDPHQRVTSLLIFRTPGLEPFMRIATDVRAYLRLAFTHDSSQLWAVSDEDRLDRFELGAGRVVQQVEAIHRPGVTSLAMDPLGRFAVTGGADALVKVWQQHPAPLGGGGGGGKATAAGGRQAGSGSAVTGSHPSLELSGSHQAFLGHPSAVRDAAFSGNHLISVGEASSLYVWKINHTRDVPDAGNAATAAGEAPGSRSGPGLPDLTAAVHSRAAGGVPHATAAPAGDDVSVRSSVTAELLQPGADADAGGGSCSAAGTHSRSVGVDGGDDRPASCASITGYTPTGAANVVWVPETGLFAYTCDCTVVVEDLSTRRQRHLRSHAQALSTLALQPGGALLAAAPLAPEPTSRCADICVWDVASGGAVARLQYHPLAALSFSHDGRWLLSLGRDPERAVVVWDLVTSEAVAVGRISQRGVAVAWLLQGPSGLDPVTQSPGRSLPRFVSAGDEGLLLWTLHDSYLEQQALPLSSTQDGGGGSSSSSCVPLAVTAVAVDPHLYDTLVAADADGCVWQVQLQARGDPVVCVVAHVVADKINLLVLEAGGAVVATQGGRIMHFSRPLNGGAWTQQGSLLLDGPASSLQPAAGLREAVASTPSATIWFCDLQEGSSSALVDAHADAVALLCCSPGGGDKLATAAGDGRLRVWQPGGGRQVHLELASASPPTQRPTPCTSACFLPDAASLVCGHEDGSLRRYDVQQPRAELVWSTARHSSPVVSLLPHPLQRLILSAGRDGTLAVTDAGSTRLVAHCEHWWNAGHGSASAGSPSRSSAPGVAQGPTPAFEPVEQLAVSYGSALVAAAATRGGLQVFSTPWTDPRCTLLASYRCPQSVHNSITDVPSCVAFLPASVKLLAYSSSLMLGQVLLFDYRAAAVLRTISMPQMVSCLAPSPDGHLLALGSTQGALFLVDLDSGKFSKRQAHVSPVTAVTFTQGGAGVVAAAGATLMSWEMWLPGSVHLRKLADSSHDSRIL
ncbi:MAG: hypothetical protein WDW36_002979 [Sanguina aurantia]